MEYSSNLSVLYNALPEHQRQECHDERVRDLHRQWKNGSREAMNVVVTSYVPLCIKISRDILKRYNLGHDARQDMEQYLLEKVADKFEKFDPSKDNLFHTYLNKTLPLEGLNFVKKYLGLTTDKHKDLFFNLGKYRDAALEENEYLTRSELAEKIIELSPYKISERDIYIINAIRAKLAAGEIRERLTSVYSQDDDFENLAQLYQLIIDKQLSHKKFTHANLQEMMILNDQLIFSQKKAGFYNHRTALVTKAFLTKNLHLSSETLDFEKIEDIPEKYDDAYLQYLEKKALGYIRPSTEKQIILQEALELIDQVGYYNFNKNAAKIATLNNLALEYLLSFDYQNSIKAYEQLLSIPNLSGDAHDFILFNYLNCLLKGEEYQKSISIIERHFSTPKTSPMLSGKLSCIKAMARVFTGNLELAYIELSPHSKKKLRNNYFYSRLVLAIIFYLEQNIDLAKREIENTLQIIPDSVELHYLLFCAKSLRSFLTIEDSPNDSSLKKKLLFSSIDTFIHVDNKGSDILPLLWLRKQLLEHK